MKCNPAAFRLLLAFSLYLLCSVPFAAQAGTFTAFGPKNFIRNSGAPVTETASFSIKNPNTTYTMHIYNGGYDAEYSPVSSAVISINGTTIFTTSDFNQKVTHLQQDVILSTSNSLQVDLRSSPASAVTIIIEGVDNTPPIITISSPANNGYLNSPAITVTGNADDTISWINNVTVSGTTAPLTNGTYTLPLNLTEGVNTISTTATDAGGNTSSASISVVLDTIPPNVALDPVPPITNKPQITISGRVEDANPLTNLTINGVPVALTNNVFSTTLNLLEGDNTLTISAIDKAGNVGTATSKVFLDTIPPTVAISSPSNSIYLNTPSITVTGTATDVQSGVSTVTVNGITTTISGNTYTASNLQLTEGTNTITVVATDAAGNTNNAAVTIILDTIPPVINITSPANESIVNTSNITVTGTIDDNSAVVTINGTNTTLTNNTFTASISLAQGPNAILISATDAAGNKSTSSIAVTFKSGPHISIDYPKEGSVFSYPFAGVDGTVDDHAALVTINGVSTCPKGSQSCTRDTDEFWGRATLVDGPNTITVTATDASGQTSIASVTVLYRDNIPPSIVMPYYNYTATSSPVTVAVDIIEWGSFPKVTMNGVEATVVQVNDCSSCYKATAAVPLVVGANTLFVFATDQKGNGSSAFATIYLRDTTPPAITITSPSDGAIVPYPVIATGEIDDNLATVIVNGRLANISNNTFTSQLFLPDGINRVVVTAWDLSGNVTTSIITVNVDATPPAVISRYPANLSGVPTDSTITATFSEAINPATVTTKTFTLSSGGDLISGTVSYYGNTATFAPTGKLSGGVEYTATVKGGEDGIKDLAGNPLATDYSWSFKTKSLVQVIITEPYNGTTINKSTTIIKGTVTAPTYDLGVTVNGVPAEISGGNWFAIVPLKSGANTFEVKATDGAGNSDSQTVTIYTNYIQQHVKITANPQSGIVPLSTAFAIDTSLSNPVVSYKIDFEGDSIVDLETTTASNLTHIYDTQGLYYPTVTVTDSNGNAYTDSTVINVLDKAQMDAILKGKWEGMKGAIISGDTTAALNYFASGQDSKYKEVFEVLNGKLAAIFTEPEEYFTLISASGNRAECENIVIEDGKAFSYPVVFVKDGNGLWKISSF